MPNRNTEPGAQKQRGAQAGEAGSPANGQQQQLGTIGGTLTAAVPQHLSEDDPDLDRVGKASADSFPASDPPSQP